MKKAYLLVYSDSFGTRDEVKSYLDKMAEVTHWRYDMPHSFYVVSEYDANHLAEQLHSVSGGKVRFIITELSENRQGWLPSDSWYLINNKTYKPKTGS